MNSHNEIVRIVTRKAAIAGAAPTRHSTLRHAAEALSLRNVDQATTELLNEALARLTMLCHERDDDGRLCNVDPATGRVLVPLPWGKLGYTKWGLSPSEANVMRRIMLLRQRKGLPLFRYDRSRRAWFLNIDDYSDGAGILRQFKEWEIAVAEYRAARAQVVDGQAGK